MTYDLLWKSTLVLAAAWLSAAVLARRSAAVRHLVWLAALAGLAFLPALQRLMPVWTPPEVAGSFLSISSAGASATAQPSGFGLAGLWAAGVCVFLVRWLAGLAGAYRIARAARSLGAGEDGVELRQTSASSMPMTIGWLRPVILLPAGKLCPPLALRHESAHIARGDFLWQNLADLVVALYWFHPLAWLANRRLRLEAERACDDAVLRDGNLASDYAGTLLAAARSLSPAPEAAVAMARASTLERRIRAALDNTIDRRPARRAAVACFAAASLAIILPVAALRAQEQSKPGVYRPGDGVTLPVLTAKVEPEYTQEARDARVEGTVVLSAEISVEGQAEQIEVRKSLDPGLDKNASDAIRKWRWRPGEFEGKPVRVAVQIEVNFRLQ